MTDLSKSLANLSKRLTPHFRPEVLQGKATCFQFKFNESAPFFLQVTKNDFSFHTGRHEHPTLTLYIDSFATCIGLLTGEISGMDAFMAGTYRADGHIVESQLLLYLFAPAAPTVVHEVKD
jgi:putative sterol carrier protein